MKKLKFILYSIFALSIFIAFAYLRHGENTSYPLIQEEIVNKDAVKTQQESVKADQDTIETICDTLETSQGTIIITQRTIKTRQGTIIVTRDTVETIETALEEQKPRRRVNIDVKEDEVEDRVIIIGNKKIEIRGNFSFAQIEQLTGVPASFLIKKLQLPSGVSRTRNLGNLRRVYGFEMQDVRKYIREYLGIKK